MSHRQVLQPCMKNFSYSSAEHSLHHKPEWRIRKILQVQNSEKKVVRGEKRAQSSQMDVRKEAITLSYSWISKSSPPLTECVPARSRKRERATHTLAQSGRGHEGERKGEGEKREIGWGEMREEAFWKCVCACVICE